ncbi:NAD(P)H-binding protein [Actinoplanes sp. NPDC023714]|uniref:SDR family oxidoreductase n=1 Tax=Actinoplanes sp. NPDC023714 TaxID=3154322 RepID=UPI0033CE85F2
MRIAVAGGTGVAGRMIVEALRARGQETVTLSRGAGVDLLTGTGLDDALTGADAIVDASNVTTMSRSVSVDFFERAGRNLADAARKAGVRHLVSLSIVGIDRVKSPYYAGKLRQEEIVRAGAVPWTIQRATQFHEFPGQLLARIPGPIAIVPSGPGQPIAVREVAEELAEIVLGEPRGMAPDLAGPRVETLAGMARRLMAAGLIRRRPVLPVHIPGGTSAGGVLPAAGGPRGVVTFDEWLTSQRQIQQ